MGGNFAYNNVNIEILDVAEKPSATPGRGTECAGVLRKDWDSGERWRIREKSHVCVTL